MSLRRLPKIVIDTNVVFEGLTKQSTASGLLINYWANRRLQVYASSAVILEYYEVFAREFSAETWKRTMPQLLNLLGKVTQVDIHYKWRPASPDSDDDFLVECAMNANAVIITHNVRDFRFAAEEYGQPYMTPLEFLEWLADEETNNE